MFKLVVLSALLAVAASSGIHDHGPLLATSYAAPAYLNSAVSHQSRVDVVKQPLIQTYAAAPVAVAAPAVAYKAAPVVQTYAAALPSAVSHQSRVDVVSKPLVQTYAAAPVAVAAPAVEVRAAPVVQHYAAVPSAVSHQSRVDVVHKPVVQTYAAAPVAVAAAPAVEVRAAPVVAAPAVTYAQQYAAVPITGTAITKNVHYGTQDVVTGYSSQVYKPNLGALATPLATVSKTPVIAAARTVATLTPTYTQVQPEVTYSKSYVDVPVQTPVLSQVEVRTPVVQAPAVVKAAPAVATYATQAVSTYAAPAVATYAAAPAIATRYAAAPAVATYAAAPAVATYAAAPAIATRYAAAPAVATYAAAPAVATYAAAPAIATRYAAAPAVATYATGPAVATSYAAAAPVLSKTWSSGAVVAPTAYQSWSAPIAAKYW